MLTKRDTLILRLSEKLGILDEESSARLLAAKKERPDEALDQLMRMLGLINKDQNKILARLFNEHVRKKKAARLTRSDATTPLEAGGPSPALSDRTHVLPAEAPERTIVLGSEALLDRGAVAGEPTTVVPASASASFPNPELTELISDGSVLPVERIGASGGPPISELTVVLPGQRSPSGAGDAIEVVSAGRPSPMSELTTVLGDPAPSAATGRVEVVAPSSASDAPPTFEATVVLGADVRAAGSEVAADRAGRAHEVGEPVELVRPEEERALASDSPAFEPTLVLGSEGDHPQDLDASGRPSALDVGAAEPAFEPTLVLSDQRPAVERPELVTPELAMPELATPELAMPELAMPELATPELAMPELAMPELAMPETVGLGFEPTVVLGGEPSEAGLSEQLIPEEELSLPPEELEFEPTLLLEEQAPRRAPAPAPRPDSDELTLQLAPEDRASVEDERTMLVPDSPVVEGFEGYDGELEVVEPELADVSGGDEPDLTYVLAEEGGSPRHSSVSEKLRLEEESLSLRSEVERARAGSAPLSEEVKRGGALNREVFKRLAKERRSFSGFFIGDYKIIGEISRGAMGVVLRATPRGMAKTMAKARGFEGDVALKVMLENKLDPKEAERFLEEMKVLSKLTHPHIVRIFDCGREGGLTYYSMELLEGQNVRELVRSSGVPPVLLSLRITAQIANALAFIHRSTVYHRDLKPTNVIFDKNANPFRAVLIDFGLVTEMGDTSDKGLILGTPQYMPPEQASPRGGFGPVNATSDIYSLGATFYYMLTGKAPFEGRDPRKIIRRVTAEAVVDPIEHNPEIPRAIADICLKCLAKSQRDRWPAARVLAAELEKMLKSLQRKLKARSFINKLWRKG